MFLLRLLMDLSSSAGVGSSGDSDWSKVGDLNPEELRKYNIALRWGRLLRQYYHIRKLQWHFTCTGLFLNWHIKEAARKRVQNILKLE